MLGLGIQDLGNEFRGSGVKVQRFRDLNLGFRVKVFKS